MPNYRDNEDIFGFWENEENTEIESIKHKHDVIIAEELPEEESKRIERALTESGLSFYKNSNNQYTIYETTKRETIAVLQMAINREFKVYINRPGHSGPSMQA